MIFSDTIEDRQLKFFSEDSMTYVVHIIYTLFCPSFSRLRFKLCKLYSFKISWFSWFCIFSFSMNIFYSLCLFVYAIIFCASLLWILSSFLFIFNRRAYGRRTDKRKHKLVNSYASRKGWITFCLTTRWSASKMLFLICIKKTAKQNSQL